MRPSQGMFFGIFVFNRVSILSIFVLNRVSFLRQEPITLFLDDKQPALFGLRERQNRVKTPLLGWKGAIRKKLKDSYISQYIVLQLSLIFLLFLLFKLGIKNRNSVLTRVGKSAIFVLNRVKVWGAEPHLPTQGWGRYRAVLNTL